MSHLRSLVADQRLRVVVFGGSYGGMLSSWMRARRQCWYQRLPSGDQRWQSKSPDKYGGFWWAKYLYEWGKFQLPPLITGGYFWIWISGREIIMIHRDSEKVPETGFCGSFSTAFSDLLPSVSHWFFSARKHQKPRDWRELNLLTPIFWRLKYKTYVY